MSMAIFNIGFDLGIAEKTKVYQFQLRSGKSYRVGRQGEWLSIPDPALSRYHFELRVEHDSVRVVDLTSTNGLFLNGLKLREAPLKVGDVLEFGVCRIEVKTLTLVTEKGADDSKRASGRAIAKEEQTASTAKVRSLSQQAHDDHLVRALSPLRTPGYFFRLALKQPHLLFRDADYRQPSRDSYLLILFLALAHWNLGNARHLLSQALRIFSQSFIFAAGVLTLATVFALLMKTFREKIEVEAGFRQFLALFSFIYVLFLPIFIVFTIMAGGLQTLGWLAFSAFALFATNESLPVSPKKVVPAFFVSWIVALIPALILISLVL